MILYIFFIVLVSAIVVVVALSQFKGSRGWWGELTVRLILSFLPDEYKVYNDVRVHAGGRKCQIDHLVVSPYGIFVIETKSYLGLTSGRSRDKMLRRNVLGKNFLVRNPLFQNQYHIDLLIRRLSSVEGFDSGWLKSVVVFGFGSIVRLSDKPSNVMMFYRLYSHIRSFRTVMISKEISESLSA